MARVDRPFDHRISCAQISHSADRRLVVPIVGDRTEIGGPCRDRTYDQRIKRNSLILGHYTNQALATHAKFQEQQYKAYTSAAKLKKVTK